jgi:hypothetical protein
MALVTTEVTWLQWLLEDFVVSASMSTSLLSVVQGLLVLLVVR